MTTEQAQSPQFLTGGGEMGELIRTKKWQHTPIGIPENWPPSLQTAVSILLNSQFPMFVWWGKDLITIYNDPYIPVAGAKHPTLLGQSGREGWAEIWKDLSPLVESVFRGAATWSEDRPLYINRKGYVEETYFTFSYSPVRDEQGKVTGLFCACIETTEKVLAARRVQESERNLRATILQSPVAMSILHGPQFVVEIANERMFELWGKPAGELLHKPIFEGLPEVRNQALEELLEHVYTTGETFSASERPVSLSRYGKTETLYVNFVYEPFREGDGQVSGIIVVANDVTEQVLARQKLEESEVQLQQRVQERTTELENLNNELQRTNQNLEEFAYAASHDMKEPIRKIHLFTDRLKQELYDKLNDTQKHLFSRVENAALRMNTLIEDLLLYSHISKGVSSLEDIDLSKKLQNVLEDLEVEIEEKKAHITYDHLPTIKGQRRQIQQLFQNLIGNALKYSKADVAPEIRISCETIMGHQTPLALNAEESNKRFYLIKVQDNGIGFEQEDAERIFNVFTRLHGNAEYRGTGVGLSIVQKVVENHHGHIWAEGNPDEGATFNVLFPVA